jgi:hypothetical protein
MGAIPCKNMMRNLLSYTLRTRPGLVLGTLLAVAGAAAAPTDDVYRLGADSMAQEGVPKGKVIGPLTLASFVFTNTTCHYWVFVPAQNDPKTPAALMIFQDGQAFVGLNDLRFGTHSDEQGGAIMPEMLRWLWRDYPRPDDPKDDRERKLFVSGEKP